MSHSNCVHNVTKIISVMVTDDVPGNPPTLKVSYQEGDDTSSELTLFLENLTKEQAVEQLTKALRTNQFGQFITNEYTDHFDRTWVRDGRYSDGRSYYCEGHELGISSHEGRCEEGGSWSCYEGTTDGDYIDDEPSWLCRACLEKYIK